MATQLEPSPDLETIEGTMEQLLERMHVNTVFGQPVERFEQVVIPCAEISLGMGFGGGGGVSPSQAEQSSSTRGSGVGGGGGGRSRPIAAIVITPNGVSIKPILDLRSLALTALATVGITTFLMTRLARLNRLQANGHQQRPGKASNAKG
jgi:uncharacterized spore protein YtfJ